MERCSEIRIVRGALKAVLRRVHDSPPDQHQPLRSFANWQLNEEQSELIRDDGMIVFLSASELALLKAFLAHPGEILSRDDLTRLTRGREALALERAIDNSIARLRKKIEQNPTLPRIIKTVRGDGYRLIAQPTGG